MFSIKVLVIDDDEDLCKLIDDALSDTFELTLCTNSDDALTTCENIHPAIVLLDLNLKPKSGLEICKDIQEKIPNPPMVLFISGENTPEQRLATYECGGDDFLPKPFQLGELGAKVSALAATYNQRAQLKRTNEYATKTAMRAMVEASQYGGVLRFFNDMYKADNPQKIKDSFFQLMKDFELKASIQFRLDKDYTYNFDGQNCSPIEMQIYDSMSKNGRIIPFSNRVMVNGDFVSFIIKNMPVDDELTCGRLKDILATLIQGLSSKVIDLQRLTLLKQTAREVAASSQRLSDIMTSHEGFVVGAMTHLISEIKGSFDILEMNEEQETFFTGLTETIISSVEDSFVNISNEQDVLNCLWRALTLALGSGSEDEGPAPLHYKFEHKK
ncbi:MAG: CheY-like chemotaxis protein [Lentisphaeria bacterium]|jgi:CheY-like chemotaxis protein